MTRKTYTRPATEALAIHGEATLLTASPVPNVTIDDNEPVRGDASLAPSTGYHSEDWQ